MAELPGEDAERGWRDYVADVSSAASRLLSTRLAMFREELVLREKQLANLAPRERPGIGNDPEANMRSQRGQSFTGTIEPDAPVDQGTAKVEENGLQTGGGHRHLPFAIHCLRGAGCASSMSTISRAMVALREEWQMNTRWRTFDTTTNLACRPTGSKHAGGMDLTRPRRVAFGQSATGRYVPHRGSSNAA